MIKPNTIKIEKGFHSRGIKEIEEFSLTPLELEEYLDRYVIGQKDAKALICTKICTHFHKIRHYYLCAKRFPELEFVKNNILMIGPTGVGKTFIIKLISKKLGVPFVKGDATKFSETGYVGGDIEDLIRELYWEANEDLDKAHFGMIFLDEIDKIASSGESIGPDISRTGVQRALLKPLEETKVEIKFPQEGMGGDPEGGFPRKRKRMFLNTRFVLFVAGGAFQGLEEIIKKRLKKSKLGFIAEVESEKEIKLNYMKFVIPEDLVNYGFEREFIGRFPVVAIFDPLTEEELFAILANPNSVIVLNKKRDFKVYGIDLVFTDEALKSIASKAYKHRTGARALVSVLEKALTPFERVLPSKGLEYLAVTKELIEDPEGYLASILNTSGDYLYEAYLRAVKEEAERFNKWLKEEFQKGKDKFELTPKKAELIFEIYKSKEIEAWKAVEELKFLWHQVKNYEKVFEHRTGIKVCFTENAIDEIIEAVLRKNWGVFAYCEKVMSRLEYRLKYLVDEKSRILYITPQMLKKPSFWGQEAG